MSVGRANDYLTDLDCSVRDGLAALSQRFRARHADYVLQVQNADGGFPGRQGPSDLYYTCFALRCAQVLGIEEEALWQDAARFLAHHPPVRDVVECFSTLEARSLLDDHALRQAQEVQQAQGGVSGVEGPVLSGVEGPVLSGVEGPVLSGVEGRTSSADVLSVLKDHHVPSGGYARRPGEEASVYHTFLAALSYRLLGREMPRAEEALAFVRSQQLPSGSFTDVVRAGLPQVVGTRGLGCGGVNPTGAGVGVLATLAALEPAGRRARKSTNFILAMQREDGGFGAHCQVAFSDLLSTFTALVTLSQVRALRRARLAAVARFAGGLALSGGGFCSSESDDGADVEYTYYGLGTLGLLALEAAGGRRGEEFKVKCK